MNIWEICEDAIKVFCEANGIKYAAVEYIPDSNETALPDEYIVYTVISDPNNTFYNNKPVSTDYRIQFDYMTRKTYKVATVPPTIENLLIKAGFLMQGNGRVRHEEKTGHWYWQKDFKKRLIYKGD